MRHLTIAALAIVILAGSCGDSSGDGATEPDPSPDPAPESPEPETDPEPEPAGDTEPEPEPPPAEPVVFGFTVEGVQGGFNVPVEFTCDGANATPAVTILGVPEGIEELALIVDDPDAPTEFPFVHWLVYGIGPETTVIDDADESLTYGTTDAATDAWFGPCPPPGDGLHTYRWKLFGLSMPLGLDPGLDGRALEAAIDGSVVADSLLISSYERPE